MPATTANKEAVVTLILKMVRELDIQGFTNQDNKDYSNLKYKIDSITTSVSPVFKTTITMDSIADAANFRVNEVIKFYDIVDATLETELSEFNLSVDERKIRSIVGTVLTLNLDSSSFAGTFTSGKLCSTYDIEKLLDIAETSIGDFEVDTGIVFLSDSHIHMSFIKDLMNINFGKLSGAEKSLAKMDYKDRLERIQRLKGWSYTSQDVDTTTSDEDSDFGNDEFLKDMGLGSSDRPLTD